MIVGVVSITGIRGDVPELREEKVVSSRWEEPEREELPNEYQAKNGQYCLVDPTSQRPVLVVPGDDCPDDRGDGERYNERRKPERESQRKGLAHDRELTSSDREAADKEPDER